MFFVGDLAQTARPSFASVAIGSRSGIGARQSRRSLWILGLVRFVFYLRVLLQFPYNFAQIVDQKGPHVEEKLLVPHEYDKAAGSPYTPSL